MNREEVILAIAFSPPLIRHSRFDCLDLPSLIFPREIWPKHPRVESLPHNHGALSFWSICTALRFLGLSSSDF
jgi:hypothetical protein